MRIAPEYRESHLQRRHGRLFLSSGAASAGGGSINGELAGGTVMSLMTRRDSGIVVAVLSNIAHANTSALCLKIGDAFARQAR